MHGGGVGGDAGLRLVFTIQGDVVDGGGFTAEVGFARHVLHLNHFHVFHQGGGHVIDVRQLLAFVIHLEVVGVALPGGDAVIAGLHDPGIQMGEVGGLAGVLEVHAGEGVVGVGQFPVGHVDLVEDVAPHAFFGHIVITHDGAVGLQELIVRVQRAVALFREVRMEGLQEVSGLQELGVALPASDGEMHGKSAVAGVEGQGEGLVVDDFELHGLAGSGAAVAHPRGHNGSQLLVEHEVLNAELDVFHGHFFAVGPLESLAELEGEHGLIVIGGELFHHVGGDDVGVGALHGQEVFIHAHEAVGVPVDHGGDQAQGAAVIAALIIQVLVQDFLDDTGGFGKTLFHGGKLAGLNGCIQHRSLGVVAFGGRGHGEQRYDHRQNQQPRQLFHVGFLLFLLIRPNLEPITTVQIRL